MTKLGLDYRVNCPHKSVEKKGDKHYVVHLQDGSSIECEAVLQAIGRPPNTEPLKLEVAGVEVVKGAVKVDEYQNTNVPGIYAIGDVTNQVSLTPVAIRQGRIVSERLFNNKPDLKVCYDNIATVIFSHPVIGSVGVSEDQAIEKWGADKIKCYRSKFINMYYSPALTQEKK